MASQTMVIWNPGASRAAQAVEARHRLEHRANTTFCEAASPEAIGELARRAVSHAVETLVVAGGDGTIRQAVQAVEANFQSTRLAILPLGTANDLCRTLNVPEEPLIALELLNSATVQHLDAIRLQTSQGRYFCMNLASAGNSSEAIKAANPDSKRLWGRFAYLRHAIDRLREPRRFQLKVQFDMERPRRYRAVNFLVANGRWGGGNLPVAPRASPTDGLLDVLVLLDGTLLDFTAAAAKLVAGEIEDSDVVVYRRVRELHVDSSPPLEFSLDGDVATRGPARVKVVPQSVPMLVGPEYREGNL